MPPVVTTAEESSPSAAQLRTGIPPARFSGPAGDLVRRSLIDMSDLQCASRLILARHGEAEYETSLWSDAGGSLSAEGRRQAAALADRLAERRVAHVWSSTMARAVQTAEIVAARLGIGVTTRDALCEFGVGDHAGSPLESDPFADTFARWLDGDLAARVAGAESGTEVVDRMHSVLQEIADQHRGESVLVVSHGGVLSLTARRLVRLNGITPARLANCDTIDVDVDADGWVCRAWG